MSNRIEHPPAAPLPVRPPADPAITQHQGLMAALVVAGQVAQCSPIPPTSLTPTCYDFAPAGPYVDVFFSGPAAQSGVAALADVLGVAWSVAPHSESDPRAFVSARAVVAGVSVHAWALLSEVATGDASEVSA